MNAILKKEINLSYGEIGELFAKQKSYIHKAVDDITFMVEKHGQKHMVSKVTNILKDIEGGPSASIKNT